MRHLKQNLIRLTGALCAAGLLFALSGCKQKQVVLDNEQISNFTMPEIGEDIAVLTIKDYGEVKIRLFPEETQKGVENFEALVKQGFYDELIFHRIEKDFVIQGGDPKGNGSGFTDSFGGSGFEQTIASSLHHFTGAVAYATASDKLNGCQFYIVTGEPVNADYFSLLAEQTGGAKQFSPRVQQLYEQFGGQPFLDGDYEVFGQVFDGLDICLRLQNVPVDENSKPRTQVVIEKAEIVPYDGAVPHWLNAAGEEQTLEGGS